MFVRVHCPNPDCARRYKVDRTQLGHRTVCKSCGREFTVGVSGQETLPPDAQAGAAAEGQAGPAGDIPRKLGRFEIRGRLGAGAFGAVYRAHDPLLDREVALKVPRAAVLERPEARARFLREPKAAAQLRHPHIVPVYDAGRDGEHYYIASAYIEGHTLEEMIDHERPDFRRAAEIVRDLAEALDYAHRMGVVHRDVKPANIMIDGDGQAMLMDFGLARLETSEEKLTQDGSLMGTPAYMAPEQADGSFGEVGPASDQYSLAVVLYELLCGEPPFSGPPTVLIFNALHSTPDRPQRRNPGVPVDLETICLKAMARSPGDRYTHCSALAEDLRRWLADEPIQARRSTSTERLIRWARRNPVLAGLSTVVAVLAVISTAAAGMLLASRIELRAALVRQEQLTDLAQGESHRAGEQTRYAQEQEALAREQADIAVEKEQEAKEREKEAKDALSNLQAEVRAHSQTKSELSVTTEKREELAAEVEKTLSRAATAEKQAERERTERQEALSSVSWVSYVENLSAADRAYADKDIDGAVRFLGECPAEHRAWEWYYLEALCKGLRPREATIRLDLEAPGAHWSVSSDAEWVVGYRGWPDTRATSAVFRLPETRPSYTLRYRASGFLSPGGRILFIPRRLHDAIISIADDRPLFPDLGYVYALGDSSPFSLDGGLLAVGKLVEGRSSLTVIFLRGNAVSDALFDPSDEYVITGPVAFAGDHRLAVLSFPREASKGDDVPKSPHVLLWTLADGQISDVRPVSIDLDFIATTRFALSNAFWARRTHRFLLSFAGKRGVLGPVRAYGETMSDTVVFDVGPPARLLKSISQPSRVISISPDGKRVGVCPPGDTISLQDAASENEVPRLRCLPWHGRKVGDQATLNSQWTSLVLEVGQAGRDTGQIQLFWWHIDAPVGSREKQ
ncbi:MAG: hypothetical protein A2V70_14640 [Planctomycetes bacterium RBG_13_63_9]|nr:MAG: hypothetical protein A2V70_14640 [Planctomycetes bacterium RBG_13_63_9]